MLELLNLSFDRETSTMIVLVMGSLLIALIFFILARLALNLQHDPIRERLTESALNDVMVNGSNGQGHAFRDALAGQIPQFKIDNGMLNRELRRAGHYKPAARNQYLAFRNALVILSVITTVFIVVGIADPRNQTLAIRVLVVGLTISALCWALPRIYLHFKGVQRVRRIRRSLPDALDMITMCLTGGLSLPDALTHVSREIFLSHPDLAIELLIVRQQADMNSLDLAFRQFAHRIDAPEIVSIAALISQGQRLGTDVVSTVRDYADSMRLKRRQQSDERSNKAGIKMLFPITMCLMPSVFILLWGPALLDIVDFFQTSDLIN